MEEHKRNAAGGITGGILFAVIALAAIIISFFAREDAGAALGNFFLVIGLLVLITAIALLASGLANRKEYNKYKNQNATSDKKNGGA